MTTFEPCIRNIRADGYAKVYIRVTKNTKPAYIGTEFVVSDKQVSGKKIKDPFVKTETMIIIRSYIERLNKVNSDRWNVKDVVEYLLSHTSEISFTEYYDMFIKNMIDSGRKNASTNYKFAIQSLLKFCNKDRLYFSEITSKTINAWIETLGDTKRVKNMYPTCIRTVFTKGLVTYNDYDNDDIRIKNQPFMRVSIPKTDKAKKRSISREVLLKLFNVDLSGIILNRTKVSQDVAIMSFCLAGINIADLYYLEKTNRIGNKLCYNRHKTKTNRDDNAYTEIIIPDLILHLFEKYEGSKRLLVFSEMIKTEKAFLDYIDLGLKDVAKIAGVTEKITTYVFRHTFATIAQNNCGASTELVGFALNHASAHKITEGYITKDYSPINTLNSVVLEFVFGMK